MQPLSAPTQEDNLETNCFAMAEYIEGLDRQNDHILDTINAATPLPTATITTPPPLGAFDACSSYLSAAVVPTSQPNGRQSRSATGNDPTHWQQSATALATSAFNSRQLPPPPAHRPQRPAGRRPTPSHTQTTQHYFILREPDGRRLAHIVPANEIDCTPLTAECVIDLSVSTGYHLVDVQSTVDWSGQLAGRSKPPPVGQIHGMRRPSFVHSRMVEQQPPPQLSPPPPLQPSSLTQQQHIRQVRISTPIGPVNQT